MGFRGFPLSVRRRYLISQDSADDTEHIHLNPKIIRSTLSESKNDCSPFPDRVSSKSSLYIHLVSDMHLTFLTTIDFPLHAVTFHTSLGQYIM